MTLSLGQSAGRKDLISDLPSSKICRKAQAYCWGGTCARTSCPSYHPGVDAPGWQHREGGLLWQGQTVPTAVPLMRLGNRPSLTARAVLSSSCSTVVSCFYPSEEFRDRVWAQQLTKGEVSKYFCLGTTIASGSSSSNVSCLPSYALRQHRGGVGAPRWGGLRTMSGTSTIVQEPLYYGKPLQVWHPVTQLPWKRVRVHRWTAVSHHTSLEPQERLLWRPRTNLQ